MYRTESLEKITVKNVIKRINTKIEEMEKQSYRLVTILFWGTEKPYCFQKGVGRQLALNCCCLSILVE